MRIGGRAKAPPSTAASAAMPAALGAAHLDEAAQALQAARDAAGDDGPIALDASGVADIDSVGAAWLALQVRTLEAEGRRLVLIGANATLQRRLEAWPMLPAPERAAPQTADPLTAIGGDVFDLARQSVGLGALFADTAAYTAETLLGRHKLRPDALALELAAIGSRALGVVGLISLLVGATMALQSAAQLRKFGADIFVVDLVALSMLRELGPLMAAIVVAGRSGSAIAAEIGTMVVTEEVDALRTLGLQPVRFLLVPKVLAFTIAQPLLAIYANALGVAGGALVAVLYLNIGPDAFWQRLQEQIELRDVLAGVGKSVVFAWLICLIGAYYGFATRGGADAVGKATTSAVVAGIFAVVVADALASIVLWF